MFAFVGREKDAFRPTNLLQHLDAELFGASHLKPRWHNHRRHLHECHLVGWSVVRGCAPNTSEVEQGLTTATVKGSG